MIWWEPSISIDNNFLQLVPYLNSYSLAEYPLVYRDLVVNANEAVNRGNVLAALGGLHLNLIKQEADQIDKEFEFVPQAHMDRLFGLLANTRVNRKMENTLIWLGKMIFKTWCKTTSRPLIEKMAQQLRLMITMFEGALKMLEGQRELNDIGGSLNSALQLFATIMEIEKTVKYRQEFRKSFVKHTLYITSGKRQIQFYNMLYQFQFILLEHFQDKEPGLCYKDILQALLGQLYYLANTIRLPISIEHLSFVLKIILKYHSIIPVDRPEYFDLIYIIIDRNQIVRNNLLHKGQFYSYHMKQHLYFYYLQKIHSIKLFGEQHMIYEWKDKIRKCLEKRFDQLVQIRKSEASEAVFYLQLRVKELSLFGTSKKICDFPDFHSNVIKRTLVCTYVRNKNNYSSQKLAQDYMGSLLNDFQNVVNNYHEHFNQVEKGVFVYYLHYYQGLILPRETDRLYSHQDGENIIKGFFGHLKPQELIEIVDFFLIDIELGNYHMITIKKELLSNQVSYFLYASLVKALYDKINDLVQNEKKISNTCELNSLFWLTKEFIVLFRAVYLQRDAFLICRKCKTVQNSMLCCSCEEITLGIQLSSNMNLQISNRGLGLVGKDELMSTSLKQSMKKIRKEVRRCLTQNRSQFLLMYNMVLEQLIIELPD